MTDENPYRFASDADELTAPREPSRDASLGTYRRPDSPPILTPAQVRRLAVTRERFPVAFVIAAVWNLLTLGWGLFAPRVLSNPPTPGVAERIGMAPDLLENGVWASQMLLFFVAAVSAYRMQHFANRSLLSAFVVSLLLYVPFIRYGVAFFLMEESRVTLVRHGIRMGFFRAWPGSLPGRDAQ